MEEYAYIIDYLPQGRAEDKNFRKSPLILAIGENEFKLLEILPKPDAVITVGDKIYIGKSPEKRDKIISIILLTIIFFGLCTLFTLSVISSKDLKGSFFLSSRTVHMLLFPNPGRSSSVCILVFIASELLKKSTNLCGLSSIIFSIVYGSSLIAALVNSL